MTKKNPIRVVTRDAYLRNTSAELLENRQAEFVISSEAVDSYNTVFKIDGWDLTRYQNNPVVFYQHRADSDDPDNLIGTSTIRREDDKLIGTVTFEDAETNPKAEKILRKVQAGTLKMASVGARVLKARLGDEQRNEDKEVLYFDRQELLEWSIVSVGSNPEAYKRNAQTAEEIKHSVTEQIPVVSEEIKTKQKSVQEARIIINHNRNKK